MNRLYFSKFLLLAAVVLGCTVSAMAQTTTTFTQSNTPLGTATFTVPYGAHKMSVTVNGGRGGYAKYQLAPPTGNGTNGAGAQVQVDIPVTGGQVFQINIGGAGQDASSPTNSYTPYAGGYNGGGTGFGFGAGGGGASDIRNGAYALSNRIVVAGGGGGWGGSQGTSGSPYSPGGCGGGLSGQTGYYGSSSNAANGGVGGSQAAGGAHATGDGTATDGSLGNGGNGGTGNSTSGYSGGGGGGYYGGGGGFFGGGGGGSSFADPNFVTSSTISYSQCANDGPGNITINTDCNSPVGGAIVGPSSVCACATNVQYTNPTSSGGAVWTSSNASIISINSVTGIAQIACGVTSSTVVTLTSTITYGCGVPGVANYAVTVNPLPDPITSDGVSAPIKAQCAGDCKTVFASGVGIWSSSNTNIATASNATTGGTGSGLAVLCGIAAGSAVISYTLPTGCRSVATATVNPIPQSIVTAAPPRVCQNTAPVTFSDASAGGVWSVSTGFVAISSGGVINPTTAGSGNVVYTYSATGCNVSVPFAVEALPTNIPLSQNGGPHRCSNGPGIDINLPYTDPGVSYKLYQNGVLYAPGATGDGTALDFGLIKPAGVYSVVATSSPLGCVTHMTGTATIIIDTAPNAYFFHLDGPGTYCNTTGSGVHIVIDTTQMGMLGHLTYAYDLNGSVAGNIFPDTTKRNPSVMSGLITTPGNYTVIATDPDANSGSGCSTQLVGSYNVNPEPLPDVQTMNGGGNYCIGGTGVSVGLNNSVVGITYCLNLQPAGGGGAVADTCYGGTGAGFSFGMKKRLGTYNVVATNDHTGCTSNATYTAPIVVGTNPLPVKDTVEGSAHICKNSTTGAPLDLKSSAGGIRYQLYRGGVATGLPVNGTGTSVSLGAQLLGGLYSVIGTDTLTGCTSPMADTVAVVLDSIPSSSSVVSGGGAFCIGSSTGVVTVISNSEFDVFYQRIRNGLPIPGEAATFGNGSTLNLTASTDTGVFTVLATKYGNGCTVLLPGSATASYNLLPQPYAVSGGGVYCIGNAGVNIHMPNSGLGINYRLYRGITPVSPVVSGSNAGIDFGTYDTVGIYNVVATNVTTGCTNSMLNTVSVSNTPKPGIYAVTATGSSYCAGGSGVDVMLSSSQAGIKYQFYRSGFPVGSLVNGTGLMLDFGLQTLPGSYSIMAADSLTGCSDTMYGKAIVVINALPTVYTVSGGGNYCAGGAGMHVTLSNSETTVNYQLYNGTMPVGAPVRGTGTMLDLGAQTAGGTYTVMAANNATTCNSLMSGSATINVNILPAQYHVTGGSALCAGSTGNNIMLSNSESGVTYHLYHNDTAIDASIAGTIGSINFGVHSAAGSYTIVGTRTASGCSNGMADSTAISINALPAAYTLSGASTFCAGSAGTHITNSGSAIGVNYQLVNGTTPVGIFITGTGSLIDFGVPAVSGTYNVIATDALTGCTNMPTPVSVTINALPATQTITGGGHYCIVTSGAPVGLASSDAGINYQLYRGTTAAGASMPGGGYPVAFGNQKIAGTYTVVATDAVTGCTSTMPGSVDVTADSVTPPTVTIATTTHSDTVCDGNTYTFTAVAVNGGSAPAFAWSVNGSPAVAYGSTYTYVPANGDILSVQLTSSAACAVPAMATISKLISTQAYILPSATLAVTPGNAVCAGTTATFTASPVNDGYMQNYNWIKNGVIDASAYGKLNYSYVPANGDVVIFMLGSNYPCRLKDTVFSNTYTMTVDPGVAPTVTIIASQGTRLVTGQVDTFVAVASNVGLYPTYQWYENGAPIAGATGNKYISSQFFDGDSLSCTVTSSTACGMTGYNALVLTIERSTGVGQVNGAAANIQVLPNPSKGEFSVKGTLGVHADEDVMLEVTNMLGQVIYSSKTTATGGNINARVQLSNVAAGMYLLNVRSGVESNVYHIVIEQ